MRMKIWGAGALAAAAVLGGCERNGGGGAHMALTGDSYCAPFRNTAGAAGGAIASASTDPAGAVDDCVHREAYALASDPEAADTVAQAVMNACSGVLTSWSQQLANQTQAVQPSPDQSPDQTGAAANPALAQKMGMAEGRALFYVVQARAAGCKPPPANTLPATAGVGG